MKHRIVRRSLLPNILVGTVTAGMMLTSAAGFSEGDIGGGLFMFGVAGLPCAIILLRLPRMGVQVVAERVYVRGYFKTKVLDVNDIAQVTVVEDSSSLLPSAGPVFTMKDGSQFDPPAMEDYVFGERGRRRVEASAALIKNHIAHAFGRGSEELDPDPRPEAH